jgi:uncharacterized protein YdhG (YjbR/CyaY superfamily)
MSRTPETRGAHAALPAGEGHVRTVGKPDPGRYQDSVQDARRQLFDRLQALVLGMYPGAELKVSYGILLHRVGKGWVGLGFWKEGVSVYTSVPSAVAAFRAGHPGIKTGKGSINFRLTDKVPVAALRRVVRAAIAHQKWRAE